MGVFRQSRINVVFSGGDIMDNQTRIFIAEDHAILRDGLRAMLSTHPGFEIIGEAEDGREAIRGIEHSNPDLIILDLSMPKMNGMEAIGEIKKISPEIRILVLTIHKSDEYILPVLEAGADGYMLKYDTQAELLTAIKSILGGKHYLSPGVSAQVIEGYLDGHKTIKHKSSWDTLTKREREVLKLVAEGYKNREIADYLCISAKTVVKHRSNLMEKLDIHNISTLTAYAVTKGLVTKKE
jgi:DNA-binding NarL/FixJ family response regulator